MLVSKCVAFNEVNIHAAASFQANFPDAIPFVGNIVDVFSNDIIKNELLPKLGGVGKLDLLCGGPPCQEYSRSQVRRSQKVETKDVPTSYLFQEMIRVIKILQPKVFLFENVEGLLTAKWKKKESKERYLGGSGRNLRALKDTKSSQRCFMHTISEFLKTGHV